MKDQVEAAVDGLADPSREEAGRAQDLRALTEASPSRVARALLARATPWRQEEVSLLAEAANTVLRSASCRTLLRLNGELRGLSVASLHTLPGIEIGWAGLLSMQRDGYTREAATRSLAARVDPLSMRLLMLRCNDVVPQVSGAATHALTPWLTRARATAWCHALPLLEAMRRTVRASRSGVVETIDGLLAGPGAPVDAALREAAQHSRDAQTRGLAIEKLVRRPTTTTTQESILAAGLHDPHPRVRMKCARLVGSSHVPPSVRAELIPHLEASASPNVRLFALRLRRKSGGVAATPFLLAATLDPNANVRHYARRYAARTLRDSSSRLRALEQLANAGDASSRLVGALAALSDTGRSADRPAVRPFLQHGARRVREEAARTMRVLGGPPESGDAPEGST